MSDDFKPLDEAEVVYVENKYILSHLGLSSNNFNGLVLTADQLKYSIQKNLKLPPEYDKSLFDKGMPGSSLKFGAKGWQAGKFRVRLTVEFCPDEPEIAETNAINEPETSEPESPLDDIRRMMKEDDT